MLTVVTSSQMCKREETKELQLKLDQAEQELVRLRAQQRKKTKRPETDITESEAVTTLQFIRTSLFQVSHVTSRQVTFEVPAVFVSYDSVSGF